MAALRAAVVALGIAIASPASAATVHGLVYDDTNRDGVPSAGEPGIANAVVAFGVSVFATTDASGQFDLHVPDGARGIVWVRVPDGFTPGPVWARWRWDDTAARDARDLDLGLRRLHTPSRGPLTFVVAADTHIAVSQDHVTAADLAVAATAATALEPAPAFFTILGDVTQGSREAELELVDAAVGALGVPFIPVPGNHDWYDEGEAWFRHYGPDNYSFDLGDVHFVVWNMAMADDDIRRYLGAELARVPRTMTIVALTHAPPSERVTDVLRELGVDYLLTGHTHSNRVIDHGGVIELNTEPFVMGGLDFTPAGYRVITLDRGRLASYHRTTVDAPYLAVVAPSASECVSPDGGMLIVAAELDAGPAQVTARIDCRTPIALRYAGGWSWQIELPALASGTHTLSVEAIGMSGTRLARNATFQVCRPPPAPEAGEGWTQLGGGPTHAGARAREVAPPLAPRWTTAVGGHVITAAPIIAGDSVYVATTDLADGNTGGIVALDLATGAQRWRVPTLRALRGGIAVAGDTLVVPQIDGVVLGIDATSGALRWRHELSSDVAAQAGAIFGAPAADLGDALVGHQRAVAALAGSTGAALWTDDPVPDGADSQSAAAIAIGEGIAVGTFNRALGGLLAWDRATGKRLWSAVDEGTVAINASPVIARDAIYLVSGATEVTALDLAGQQRWRVKLDDEGFEWGNATVGTPALAGGILVVPTLYRDLVALDAATGAELWRHGGTPGPLRTTHYRGGREAGFAASPVITGDVVWAVDTAGVLAALELRSGRVLWRLPLGVPVLAGPAASGDWLVVASYDGTVRALAPVPHHRERRLATLAPACTDAPPPTGCCDAGRAPASAVMFALLVFVALRRRRR